MEKGKNPVLSVDKAFNIIETLMENQYPMTLKELSVSNGYPRSTVHALLATMMNHDVVTQDSSGAYFLGDRLFEYGLSVFSSWSFIQFTKPYLRRISVQTGYDTILAYVNKGRLVNVGYYAGKGTESEIMHFIGKRNPFHATAQGKVFLAFYSDKIIRNLIKKEGMKKYTDNTITEFEVLMTEINLVRKHGYAVGNGELDTEKKVVSVPVYEKNGNVIYALGVMGSSVQIKDEDISGLVKILKREAKKLSELF